ncbi:MAG TPA: hypothetical protein VJ304_09360, partial [Flavobacterium sp.]|nr:hypothetical protein [Flavobacterium sp.]
MKKILFLVMMIGVSLHGFAQDELNRKQQSIQPKNSENKEVIPPTEVPPTAEPPALSKEPIVLKINPDELFNNNVLYKREAN